MESVEAAVGLADKALATLEELTAETPKNAVERDAAIKRFEYSYDTGWKAGREFLARRYKLDRNSPTTVFRGFMDAGLIGPPFVRQLLALGDDRNKTAHTYRQSLAEEVAERLPEHAKTLRRFVEIMKQDRPL